LCEVLWISLSIATDDSVAPKRIVPDGSNCFPGLSTPSAGVYLTNIRKCDISKVSTFFTAMIIIVVVNV
jgi:hypothetical protein